MPLSGSYLDRDELKARTIAPAELVDGDWIDPTGAFTDPDKIARRTQWQAFVDSRLISETSRMNARLRKRYAVPFDSSSVPEIVRGWLADVVTPLLYKRRGWDPSDAQAEDILEAAKAAIEEQLEAANGEDGLFDLPLRQNTTDTGISRGGPLAYSEASPYSWMDVQNGKVNP